MVATDVVSEAVVAVERGVEFLLAAQSPHGTWRDFDLEPGESDCWVTAYVSLSLTVASAALNQNGRIDAAVNSAATWLARSMRSDGSWGYNASVPSDSDSTAHAVLVLDRARRAAPEQCFARMLELQGPDGGFATFVRRDSANSWGASHADVTPVVLQALRTRLPDDASPVRRGRAYVLAAQGADGLWQSFWWTTPLYATLVNVRFLQDTVTTFDSGQIVKGVVGVVAPTALERALACELLSLLIPEDARTVQAARSLLGLQLDDGSWPSAPVLRVTDPRIFAPWGRTDAGPLAADQHRLFTTATAVRSLGAFATGCHRTIGAPGTHTR